MRGSPLSGRRESSGNSTARSPTKWRSIFRPSPRAATRWSGCAWHSTKPTSPSSACAPTLRCRVTRPAPAPRCRSRFRFAGRAKGVVDAAKSGAIAARDAHGLSAGRRRRWRAIQLQRVAAAWSADARRRARRRDMTTPTRAARAAAARGDPSRRKRASGAPV